VAVQTPTYTSDGVDLLSATLTAGSEALRRRVNQVMRDGRQGRAEQEQIPFFCECGRVHCSEPVWLTVEGYDRRRASIGEPLLLHEHAVEG
jgi:hypothetical protein